MKKTLIFLAILISVAFLSMSNFGVDDDVDNKIKNTEDKSFKGPVPEGYDLENFRKTGETKVVKKDGV